LISWGHDECIYKQLIMTKKHWVGPNGETAIIPKDEGLGIMISGLHLHEFGFGLQMTKEELKKVNEL